MKDVKIVIGANYGDEGKGLMTRHFVLDAQKKNMNPIVIFHNGTAQRGHTVDYDADHRHVYHHFGSGTGDGAATFFAETFFIHPMEFHREYNELVAQGIQPRMVLFDPAAKVITPFDMVVDHATEEWIAKMNGEREFGSCGFGSWCAIEDRYPLGRTDFTIKNFISALSASEEDGGFVFMMEEIWKDCLSILMTRGVDIEKTSFAHLTKNRNAIIKNFYNDLQFFFSHTGMLPFYYLFHNTIYDSFIFENGQGLGLDVNNGNDWHTTSNTGVINPFNMLNNCKDFNAEVCYVTRSYLTRHGMGPLEEAVKKNEINADMHDRTNVYNDFQGNLRYGYLNLDTAEDRIVKDFSHVMGDKRFTHNIAITHCNEFKPSIEGKYYSNNPFEVKENK